MKKKRITLYFIGLLALVVLCGLAMATWTTPVPVTEVNTEFYDSSPFLSFDGLTLYFTRRETDTFYHNRIYEATREVPYGPFTSVRELSELNSSVRNVIWPWVSPDNLRMYYSKSVARLIFSERASVTDPWPQGSNITELNALGKIYDPALSADELSIFFHSIDISGGQGGYDIWMATRPDLYSPFGNMTNLAGINTAANEMGAFISADGLSFYFTSSRSGESQIFKATRETLNDPFGNVEHLSLYDNPGSNSGNPFLSSDGNTFYFVKSISDAGDIYVSYIPEPATLILLSFGTLALIRGKRLT